MTKKHFIKMSGSKFVLTAIATMYFFIPSKSCASFAHSLLNKVGKIEELIQRLEEENGEESEKKHNLNLKLTLTVPRNSHDGLDKSNIDNYKEPKDNLVFNRIKGLPIEVLEAILIDFDRDDVVVYRGFKKIYDTRSLVSEVKSQKSEFMISDLLHILASELSVHPKIKDLPYTFHLKIAHRILVSRTQIFDAESYRLFSQVIEKVYTSDWPAISNSKRIHYFQINQNKINILTKYNVLFGNGIGEAPVGQIFARSILKRTLTYDIMKDEFGDEKYTLKYKYTDHSD